MSGFVKTGKIRTHRLFQEIAKLVIPTMQMYEDDLLIHDRKIIEEAEYSRLLFFVRKTGVHMVYFRAKEGQDLETVHKKSIQDSIIDLVNRNDWALMAEPDGLSEGKYWFLTSFNKPQMFEQLADRERFYLDTIPHFDPYFHL